MNRAVTERRNNVVVQVEGLARHPLCGLVGSIAWTFDGLRLSIVRLQWSIRSGDGSFPVATTQRRTLRAR